ncbi:MAG: copper resistance CopC family protein [Bacillota bacterium]
MKKIIFIICILLAFPIIASAHTTVSTSTPSEGEVITEELSELSVEFAGSIENQSTLTLVHEQEEIEMDSISIEEKKMIGSLASPLENGNYTLTWKVASKDGHVLTGDILFTVSIPDVVTEEEVQEDAGQVAETEERVGQETAETTVEKEELAKDESDTLLDNSSLVSMVSVIVLVILLALGIWILLRKKR